MSGRRCFGRAPWSWRRFSEPGGHLSRAASAACWIAGAVAAAIRAPSGIGNGGGTGLGGGITGNRRRHGLRGHRPAGGAGRSGRVGGRDRVGVDGLGRDSTTSPARTDAAPRPSGRKRPPRSTGRLADAVDGRLGPRAGARRRRRSVYVATEPTVPVLVDDANGIAAALAGRTSANGGLSNGGNNAARAAVDAAASHLSTLTDDNRQGDRAHHRRRPELPAGRRQRR